jgi:hypothetical protein
LPLPLATASSTTSVRSVPWDLAAAVTRTSALLDLRDPQAPLARTASPESREPQAGLVWTALVRLTASTMPVAGSAQLDPLAHQDPQDPLDLRELTVPREPMATVVAVTLKVASPVPLETQDPLEAQARLAHPDPPARTPPAARAVQAPRDPLAAPARLDPQDPQALLEAQEPTDPQAHQVLPDPRAKTASQAPREMPAKEDHQAQMPSTALAHTDPSKELLLPWRQIFDFFDSYS